MTTNTAVVALGIALASGTAAAQTFDMLADYEAALGSTVTIVDTFDGSSQNAVSLTTDIGIVSTLTNGTPFSPPDNYYNDPNFGLSEFGFALDSSGSVATRNVVWDFQQTVYGFYGEFVSVTGIDVGIGSTEGEVTQWFDISDVADPNPGNNPAEGFFGLVDTNGFDSVIFRVDPSFGSSFDVFWLTEMGISVVPTPGSIAVLGLGCVGVARRRR
ncbi:MAG: hypothetical protein AAGI53_16685 [Planctomycetota bacterium]